MKKVHELGEEANHQVKTVTILVNRELRKLNGRERKNRDRTNS